MLKFIVLSLILGGIGVLRLGVKLSHRLDNQDMDQVTQYTVNEIYKP